MKVQQVICSQLKKERGKRNKTFSPVNIELCAARNREQDLIKFKNYKMTYNETFEMALSLETAGITVADLEDMQNAIYMNDQDAVNSWLSWMVPTLEKLDINPRNLKSIIRKLYNW